MIPKHLLLTASLLVLLGTGCATGTPVDEEGGLGASVPLSSASPSDLTVPSAPTPKATRPVNTYTFPGVLDASKIENRQIRISTPKGDIVFELFAGEAPKTVSNFVYLTREGYFDGLTFHRVEPGFVIQGGDPSGNGTGGPGYMFEDEPVSRPYDKGIVAMANRGANTNGSQFFIMLEDAPLPPDYTIFGKVTSGMDVVDGIRIGDVMERVQVEALGASL